jgi:phosphoglycerate dehydrogenase-like enzyme
MSESDYIVCSAPSMVKTQGMVDAEALEYVDVSEYVFLE